ncbi:hypothetical protein BS78_05G018800 [Paspalum vaginatum]|nr:hypothetical protein BS78_05G018800 [Paspalum vaginatum]
MLLAAALCCLSLLAAAPSAAEAANKQAPPHRCLSSPPSHRHNQPVNPSRPRPPSPTTSSAPPAARPQQQDQDAVVCLERLTSAGTPYQFQGMAAHPDGSGRAFFYTRDSTKVWLATVPAQGIALELQVDGAPFLDLAAVTEGALIRLVGLELHAEFATNGRLFVSYYAVFGAASRSASSAAAAAAGNCPAPLSVDIGHRLVVAEISAKGLDYAGMDPVALEEVRRIFNSGPLIRHQLDGGQTLLRDGHLYLVKVDDEANNTSSSSQLGPKIIRFNVDDHSVPEIYATVGLRDPRGCSFDSESPSNLYCAGVDEQGNGQVYLISDEAAKATVSLFIRNGRPKAGRAPSIFAGILYRGSDPFLNGRYLYVYGSEVWATVDSPAASAAGLHASAPIPHVRCSGSSPISCGGEAITDGNVSMVQDNSKDAFILASTGIYRLVPPNHCWGPTYHAPPSSWLVWMLSAVIGSPIMSVAFYLIWSRAFGGGGGQPATTNCSLSFVFSCCITNYNGTSVPNNGSGQGGMSCS